MEKFLNSEEEKPEKPDFIRAYKKAKTPNLNKWQQKKMKQKEKSDDFQVLKLLEQDLFIEKSTKEESLEQPQKETKKNEKEKSQKPKK